MSFTPKPVPNLHVSSSSPPPPWSSHHHLPHDGRRWPPPALSASALDLSALSLQAERSPACFKITCLLQVQRLLFILRENPNLLRWLTNYLPTLARAYISRLTTQLIISSQLLSPHRPSVSLPLSGLQPAAPGSPLQCQLHAETFSGPPPVPLTSSFLSFTVYSGTQSACASQ